MHNRVKATLAELFRWLKVPCKDLDSQEGRDYFASLVAPALRANPLPHRPDLLLASHISAPLPAMGGLLLDVTVSHWWSTQRQSQRTACSGPTARVQAVWVEKHRRDY